MNELTTVQKEEMITKIKGEIVLDYNEISKYGNDVSKIN